ncbi:Flp family type IVb pilin [Aeromicrobium sp. A1-2]|uniref:Flp family type IVb pilin n=1 Tax=Aeromicrobium sp. A1-2 TaxID=2107713 RepID=UPI000E50C2F3|nr:Flp family type IVb pilin [Aeromicrobium sp. A1-2]AXT85887.1 Flp family type IVb pilin [Aeromicrobium sp. A1-2]
MKKFGQTATDETGATGVEYALIIGLVSLAMVGAAITLGGGFTTWAGTVVSAVGTLLNG